MPTSRSFLPFLRRLQSFSTAFGQTFRILCLASAILMSVWTGGCGGELAANGEPQALLEAAPLRFGPGTEISPRKSMEQPSLDYLYDSRLVSDGHSQLLVYESPNGGHWLGFSLLNPDGSAKTEPRPLPIDTDQRRWVRSWGATYNNKTRQYFVTWGEDAPAPAGMRVRIAQISRAGELVSPIAELSAMPSTVCNGLVALPGSDAGVVGLVCNRKTSETTVAPTFFVATVDERGKVGRSGFHEVLTPNETFQYGTVFAPGGGDTGSLALWFGTQKDKAGLFASVLDKNGQRMGSDAKPLITDTDGTLQMLAWTQSSGAVLLLYTQGGAIYLLRLDEKGNRVDPAPMKLESVAPTSVHFQFAVADNQTFLAWQSSLGGTVLGHRIDARGKLMESVPIAVYSPPKVTPPEPPPGLSSLVYDGDAYVALMHPLSVIRIARTGKVSVPVPLRLASNRQLAADLVAAQDEYLALWTEQHGDDLFLYGIHLGSDGVPIDRAPLRLFSAKVGTDEEESLTNLRTASDGTSYLILWGSSGSPEAPGAWYLQPVARATKPLPARRRLRIGYAANVLIAENTRGYLVAWNSSDLSSMAMRLSPDGSVLDPSPVSLGTRGIVAIGKHPQGWVLMTGSSGRKWALRLTPEWKLLDGKVGRLLPTSTDGPRYCKWHRILFHKNQILMVATGGYRGPQHIAGVLASADLSTMKTLDWPETHVMYAPYVIGMGNRFLVSYKSYGIDRLVRFSSAGTLLDEDGIPEWANPHSVGLVAVASSGSDSHLVLRSPFLGDGPINFRAAAQVIRR